MELIEKIQTTLNKHLPKQVFTEVHEWKGIQDKYIAIKMYLSKETIHKVNGQYPQMVSLSLNIDDMHLQTQVYGGNGGGRIYREIDKEHPREKYLAMVGEKVPFRKPQNNEEAVLRAIGKFADNYIATLKAHREKLRYKDMVDYSFLD
jgi:hypothetical protein